MPILKVWDGTQFQSIGGPGVAGTNNQLQFNSQNLLTGASTLTFNTSALVNVGNFVINSAGSGIQIKEGANACMGTGILTLGATTINTTAVTANSRIFLSDEGGGVLANIGALYISSKSAGSNFTVASSNATDSSTFAWVIFNPA